MNRGLFNGLAAAFPNILRVERPAVVLDLQPIQDPNWFAGITSAEGYFMIDIYNSKTNSFGKVVRLVFQVTQHERDEQLMKIIIEYLNCGYVVQNRTWLDYRVMKLNDIIKIIISFYLKYPIQGVKALDLADWCEGADMIKDKKHLTKKGFDKIKKK